MRIAVCLVIAACGGHATTAPAPQPARPEPVHTGIARSPASDPTPVDPIAALAPSTDSAWLVPGRIQLELGGPAIDGPGGTKAIEVSLFERQGNLVRAAVRLEHARFSVWTERARLLAVLARDLHVAPARGAVIGGPSVSLKAGAVVRRLGRKGDATRIRYVGAVEVEAVAPEADLVESTPRRHRSGRVPSGRRTLMVPPGSVIRAEPTWSGAQLAVTAGSHFVDRVRELERGWAEVAYADGDVDVRGYLSRRDPPGRVHKPTDPEAPPATVTTNAKVASGTCLHARRDGDAVGYIAGDRDVALDDLGAGWWSLAIDTPWGPLVFAARGPTKSELLTCGDGLP